MSNSFTLIEILVVIVVIGILSAFILVSVGSITESANIARGKAFADSIDNSLLLSRKSYWKIDESSGVSISDNWGTNICTINGFADTTAGYGDTHNSGWMSSNNCVSGTCTKFDKVDDYIDCGDPDSLSFGNGLVDSPFSISLWTKISSDTVNGGLIAKASDSNIGEYYLYVVAPTFYFRLVDNSQAAFMGVQRSGIPLASWVHVFTTYDGTSTNAGIKIYFNGIQQTTALTNSGTYIATENTAVSLRIGRRDSLIKGLIDDVKIYNEVISSSEIQSNYYAELNKLLRNKHISLREYADKLSELKSSIGQIDFN